jgi:hypothetical protein
MHTVEKVFLIYSNAIVSLENPFFQTVKDF